MDMTIEFRGGDRVVARSGALEIVTDQDGLAASIWTSSSPLASRRATARPFFVRHSSAR